MNNSPFFSIVVPVYNTVLYLRDTLNCISAQTFTSFEVIMVDDGSTDGSETICDEYARKDYRFKVFHQSNAGVSAARNKALDKAIGKYIGFVDSDDTLLPDMLNHFYKIIQSDNPDIIQSEGTVIRELGLETHISFISLGRDQAMDEFFRIGKVKPSLWLGVYRAALFKNVRFPENIYQWEDYAIIAVLLSRCSLVSITSGRFYSYEYRAGSSTKRPMTERHLTCLQIDDYLLYNNVYRGKQDHYDVVGFFLRCCCKNYLCEPPIEKMKYKNIIREQIRINKKSLWECRSVPLWEKLVVFSFMRSEAISNCILVLGMMVIRQLKRIRDLLKLILHKR